MKQYQIRNQFYISMCMRKPTIWVPTRSDTNRAVQSQKMDRGGKSCIWKVQEIYYPCGENTGSDQPGDQLRSYCEADLRLCFRLSKLLGLPCGGSFICSKMMEGKIKTTKACIERTLSSFCQPALT